MNIKIDLCNKYFPWTEFKSGDVSIWVKGTINYGDEHLQTDAAAKLLYSVLTAPQDDEKVLKTILLELNGNYAIVIKNADYLFCAVDRVRSIPMFYAKNGEDVIVSDDANHIRDEYDYTFNEMNGTEFLITAYVTGSKTLFNDIYQLQAGEYLFYDNLIGAITTSYYHRFLSEYYSSASEDELIEKLDDIFVNVFKRFIRSAEGSQIVVPLSGGLDSRIIVWMLKRLGVEDVVCFSYGQKWNNQSEISRKVAEELDYQWHFVEYTPKKLYVSYHSAEMRKFFEYSNNLVSLPFLQEFLAVRELKEGNKIPENSIFVPGHSGDMLAGNHIPLDYELDQDYNIMKFYSDNKNVNYHLWKWDNDKLGSAMKEKMINSLGNLNISDNESCSEAIELFNFNERQAKFIINSVRAYEFFGYGWRMPLWDNELIDFFLSIPLCYRIYQRLYINCFNKSVTAPLDKLKLIECTTNLKDESFRIRNKNKKISKYIYNSLFKLDLGFSSRYEKPLLSKISILLFGIGNEPFAQYPVICDVINRNNCLHYIPSANGIWTYECLKNLLEDN